MQPSEQPVYAIARRGLWALPVWAGLLFYATFTHQPPYQSDFPGWSRYVTTTTFLVSHLLGSILGAGIGILGFVALSVVLAEKGAPRLAVWGVVTAVLGSVLTTAVFGIAAFAQPAIGRSFLDGRLPSAGRCSRSSALSWPMPSRAWAPACF